MKWSQRIISLFLVLLMGMPVGNRSVSSNEFPLSDKLAPLSPLVRLTPVDETTLADFAVKLHAFQTLPTQDHLDELNGILDENSPFIFETGSPSFNSQKEGIDITYRSKNIESEEENPQLLAVLQRFDKHAWVEFYPPPITREGLEEARDSFKVIAKKDFTSVRWGKKGKEGEG